MVLVFVVFAFFLCFCVRAFDLLCDVGEDGSGIHENVLDAFVMLGHNGWLLAFVLVFFFSIGTRFYISILVSVSVLKP